VSFMTFPPGGVQLDDCTSPACVQPADCSSAGRGERSEFAERAGRRVRADDVHAAARSGARGQRGRRTTSVTAPSREKKWSRFQLIRGWGCGVAGEDQGPRYVFAIGDGVGGHTDPGCASSVRCSAGESSSWPGQTTVTCERFRRFRWSRPRCAAARDRPPHQAGRRTRADTESTSSGPSIQPTRQSDDLRVRFFL
jgi:hypothetical protein